MDQLQQDNHLILSEVSISELTSMRKWTFFLSIMGFIGSGFMVLFGLFFGAISKFIPGDGNASKFPGILMMLLYLIIGVLYLFPSIFLFNFSSKVKIALATTTEAPLAQAFNYLRLHFKFMGIMVIVAVAFVILGIFMAIVISFIAASHVGG